MMKGMILHHLCKANKLVKEPSKYANRWYNIPYNLVFVQPHNIKTNTTSTVDPDDVKRHAALRDHWWDPEGPMKPLHTLNLLRIPFVRDGLAPCQPNERTINPLKGKKIIEVGCGGGIFTEGLAKIGAEMTGIDPGKEIIELAESHSKMNSKLQNNLPKFINTTVEAHAVSYSNYYDAVVSSEVIEHVENKDVFVKSCVELLKPGGKIFFTTPSRTRMAQFVDIFLAEYVLNVIPRGTHQYEKFMTPTELTFLLERNNCHVEVSSGLCINPVTANWTWIKSQMLFFAIQASKLN